MEDRQVQETTKDKLLMICIISDLISKAVVVLLTDKREALFFILHYFKAYPTLQNMGLYFGAVV